jgi:hypothetical protein
MATRSRSAARRSASRQHASTKRYLVVEGEPSGECQNFEPTLPGVVPPDCQLDEAYVLGEYTTEDEALAHAARINQTQIETFGYERSWAMVVVAPLGDFKDDQEPNRIPYADRTYSVTVKKEGERKEIHTHMTEREAQKLAELRIMEDALCSIQDGNGDKVELDGMKELQALFGGRN